MIIVIRFKLSSTVEQSHLTSSQSDRRLDDHHTDSTSQAPLDTRIRERDASRDEPNHNKDRKPIPRSAFHGPCDHTRQVTTSKGERERDIGTNRITGHHQSTDIVVFQPSHSRLPYLFLHSSRSHLSLVAQISDPGVIAPSLFLLSNQTPFRNIHELAT